MDRDVQKWPDIFRRSFVTFVSFVLFRRGDIINVILDIMLHSVTN